MAKYADKAEMPIIAIDFDGTINVGGEDKYPQCGKARVLSKQVINFMHKLGIKIVIWTSRDVAYNQDSKTMYDDLTPMIRFLDNNDIHYDAINKSIQFAPFHYNGRKIYAHMYVDDRGFGWHTTDNNDPIFIMVLNEFLRKVCGFDRESANVACLYCSRGDNPAQWMIEQMKRWREE